MRKKVERCNKKHSALSTNRRAQSAAATLTTVQTAFKWERETYQLQCDSYIKQRKQMEKQFRDILLDVQQKCGMKTVLLERKLAQLTTEYERLETVHAEVLKISGIEPQDICAKVDEFLQQKNERISQLELELARVAKSYGDLLDVYEEHLMKLGVPKDSHGFHSIRCLAPLSFRTGSEGDNDDSIQKAEVAVVSEKQAETEQ